MQTNQQPPEPRAKGDGSILDFHSIFATIQGEGPFAGHRAIFIRLAGCNLQCPGCDTEYTKGRHERNVLDVVHHARALRDMHHGVNLVVVTGGEPLRQPIGLLVTLLRNYDFSVQIESNGVFAPDELLDKALSDDMYGKCALVVSPKTTRVNERSAALATCFKYVLDADSVDNLDGLPIKALEHPASTGVARPPKGKPVYLNPFDAQDDEHNLRNLRAVASSCQRHGYILGVQLHKLIGLE